MDAPSANRAVVLEDSASGPERICVSIGASCRREQATRRTAARAMVTRMAGCVSIAETTPGPPNTYGRLPQLEMDLGVWNFVFATFVTLSRRGSLKIGVACAPWAYTPQ
jgi:hypothetical protein